MWVLRVELLLNALPQVLHLWGFSEVWMILWRQSVEAWRNPLPQTLHNVALSFLLPILFSLGVIMDFTFWSSSTRSVLKLLSAIMAVSVDRLAAASFNCFNVVLPLIGLFVVFVCLKRSLELSQLLLPPFYPYRRLWTPKVHQHWNFILSLVFWDSRNDVADLRDNIYFVNPQTNDLDFFVTKPTSTRSSLR